MYMLYAVHWWRPLNRIDWKTVWSKAFLINLSLDGSVVVSAFRMLHRYFTLFSSQLTRKELKNKKHFRINALGREKNQQTNIRRRYSLIGFFEKKNNNSFARNSQHKTKISLELTWIIFSLFFLSLFLYLFLVLTGFDSLAITLLLCRQFASQFFFRRTKSFTIHSQLKNN